MDKRKKADRGAHHVEAAVRAAPTVVLRGVHGLDGPRARRCVA